ncbi:MAG: DUF86 domain-containing protein [Deltaproteobacteria bacterium]|nr:DUF86 domain-containing protein [Deltaproteobacteria bacterium]MBM4322055.1 DUF86 domain-containing protein [Deltaproteobacteria bacterium]MBM4346500.1 DUF86 domain-containing protein [Deltaproteobacteria bacterium]
MPKPKVPLNREVLQNRISYIEDSLRSLERFKGIAYEEFHSNSDHFRIAFYDLHRALEAVMDIGSHILSRIPGARPVSYKDIPRLLGKNKIIPAEFSADPLNKMAGYRNRMVHFYGEITEKEIYHIVQEELEDFYTFLKHISRLLQDPAKFNLTIT